MSYDIDASLENGEPRLHIVDAESGAVRLAWHYRKNLDEAEDTPAYLEQLAIKELFRELFLLSCLRGIRTCKNARSGIGLAYQHNSPGNISAVPSK